MIERLPTLTDVAEIRAILAGAGRRDLADMAWGHLLPEGTLVRDRRDALAAAGYGFALPLPAELPLTEDHVRELQMEEMRLRVQHERTGERLAAINAVLVASGEARIRQWAGKA
jgi:hypothetical protein